MSRNVPRRKVLKGIGAAGVVGLAGCSQDNGGDGGGETTASQETTASGGDSGGELPDVLTVIGYPSSGIQIFRDYYSSYSPDDVELVVPDGMKDPNMQKQVGNPMENLTGTAPSAAGPKQEAFADLFKDEYGTSPGVFTAHTFDSVAVLSLANAAAGENAGPAIKNQMRNVANGDGMEVGPDNLVEGIKAAANGEAVNYTGASSPVDFDKRGDPAAAAYDVWKFAPSKDSGVETLDTINFEGEASGPSADSIPGGTDRTAKVGMLLPETGDLASVGKPMIQAGELAAKVINDGDSSIEIDLGFEDSQTSPQAGVNAANSLVNAGYPAVCGSASSGVNVPVSKQVFIPNQVVGCSPSSTALSVSFLEDDDFIFRTAPSDLLQGQVLAQVSAERLGGSTASTLYVNNDYGQQLSQQYSDTFTEDHSGSVWQQTGFQKQQSSYTSVLNKALSK
ncbi:ABC transporter substrate-binding protein [Haloarculaceae archaeon H-GB2-1]|nr:ABC transporter substrate-binding protein [Haloarculaceae archaeon H-GB1-1]MEA5386696.1 ABC transporter substrate-binding protein [Haloarculaceae archaeon H-GB11]MEA5408224.1 ABC transporter substrate-binding protein [Haloarculaceae archaeon H-GB2-1]